MVTGTPGGNNANSITGRASGLREVTLEFSGVSIANLHEQCLAFQNK